MKIKNQLFSPKPLSNGLQNERVKNSYFVEKNLNLKKLKKTFAFSISMKIKYVILISDSFGKQLYKM